ncbi:MAG TPA: hypothetical protein VIH35_00090 [Kiritimatiellia bacterium]|jgi:hypothetical protein
MKTTVASGLAMAMLAGWGQGLAKADEQAQDVPEAPAALRLYAEKPANLPGMKTCGGEILGKFAGEDCQFRMVNGTGDASEGREGLQAVFTWERMGCAYFTFGSDLNPDIRDISTFGYLRFNMKRVAASGSPLYLKVQMKDIAGGVGEVIVLPDMTYGNVPCDGTFHEVAIPLAAFKDKVDLARVVRPFMAVTDQGAANYPVWFDDVRLEQ